MIKKSILIFIPSSGFNEEEFTTVKNILQKSGLNVFIASDAVAICNGLDGLKIKNDVSLMNVHPSNFEAIVLIGGKGTRNYAQNRQLHKILHSFSNSGKTIAAICSAPVILASAGLLNNRRATCFTEDKNELLKSGAVYMDTGVVKDENIITASQPKAALEFVNSIIYSLKI